MKADSIRPGVLPASSAESNSSQRLQQAEMLLNISKTVAVYQTLDEILKVLVDMTTKELNADRSTIFLNDPETGELYSRVAQGNMSHEIRILNDNGIAGHVFTSGQGTIVPDAYADERFNPNVDQQTGYVTKSILCAPVRTVKGEVIGVAQVLNKRQGQFDSRDLKLLEAMTLQAAIALQSTQFVERLKKSHDREMEFIEVVSDLTAEIELGALLQKVMAEATRMLNCERSTIFLNDEKRQELFSLVGEGLGAIQIRLPNHLGIAGTVFTSALSVNIPYAYADLRFNPAFDKKNRFFHPFHSMRAGNQQDRQNHRGDPGPQQTGRAVQPRGRIAPARFYGPDFHCPGERQAFRRYPEHETIQ